MTTLIIILVIVAINAIIAAVFFYLKSKRLEQPSEPVSNPEPTTEPEPVSEPVSEPKFKVGDFIVGEYGCGKVIEVTDDSYLLDTGIGYPFTNNNIRFWDITKDAKDGDVLVVEASARTDECILQTSKSLNIAITGQATRLFHQQVLLLAILTMFTILHLKPSVIFYSRQWPKQATHGMPRRKH